MKKIIITILLLTFLFLSCNSGLYTCNKYNIYQEGKKILTICDCIHGSTSFADEGVFYEYIGKCETNEN